MCVSFPRAPNWSHSLHAGSSVLEPVSAPACTLPPGRELQRLRSLPSIGRLLGGSVSCSAQEVMSHGGVRIRAQRSRVGRERHAGKGALELGRRTSWNSLCKEVGQASSSMCGWVTGAQR